jgi:hypothetical protein
VATSECGDDAEDDEEVAARNTLECGLNWARCSFDELILPATLVNFFALKLCLQFSGLLEERHLSLLCRRQSLTSSGQRRARATRQLHVK